MNNVITNSKVTISDWISPNYEKKSISKERNITLYKRMKKRFLVFDIVMPFNSGFLVAAKTFSGIVVAIINTIKNIANIFFNKWLFIFIFIILSFLFYSFFLYVLYFLLSLHTKKKPSFLNFFSLFF